MKKRRKGNRTKNHDTPGAPARQIKFNIQVQNNTYNILIKNSIDTLGTLQLNDPKQ